VLKEALMSATDKVKNEAQNLMGKGKEAVGKATDNEDLRAEGAADQVEADARKAGERVKDTVKDITND